MIVLICWLFVSLIDDQWFFNSIALNKSVTEVEGLGVRADLQTKNLINSLINLSTQPSFYNMVLAAKKHDVTGFTKVASNTLRKLLDQELAHNSPTCILNTLDWAVKLYVDLLTTDEGKSLQYSPEHAALYSDLIKSLTNLKETSKKLVERFTVESVAMAINDVFQNDWPDGDFAALISANYTSQLVLRCVVTMEKQSRSLLEENKRLQKQMKQLKSQNNRRGYQRGKGGWGGRGRGNKF